MLVEHNQEKQKGQWKSTVCISLLFVSGMEVHWGSGLIESAYLKIGYIGKLLVLARSIW